MNSLLIAVLLILFAPVLLGAAIWLGGAFCIILLELYKLLTPGWKG